MAPYIAQDTSMAVSTGRTTTYFASWGMTFYSMRHCGRLVPTAMANFSLTDVKSIEVDDVGDLHVWRGENICTMKASTLDDTRIILYCTVCSIILVMEPFTSSIGQLIFYIFMHHTTSSFPLISKNVDSYRLSSQAIPGITISDE